MRFIKKKKKTKNPKLWLPLFSV